MNIPSEHMAANPSGTLEASRTLAKAIGVLLMAVISSGCENPNESVIKKIEEIRRTVAGGETSCIDVCNNNNNMKLCIDICEERNP